MSGAGPEGKLCSWEELGGGWSEGHTGRRGLPPGCVGERCWFTGWAVVDILQHASAMMTECEEELGRGMIDSAWTFGKRRSKLRSRKKVDGWYANIGADRREVARYTRVLGAVTRGDWVRGGQEVTRLQALGLWQGPNAPEVGSAHQWSLWSKGVMETRARVKKGVHGKQRREKRKRISKYVEQREKAFDAGNIRRTVQSVLGGKKGGGGGAGVGDTPWGVEADRAGGSQAGSYGVFHGDV
jgi:hypothetical protein